MSSDSSDSCRSVEPVATPVAYSYSGVKISKRFIARQPATIFTQEVVVRILWCLVDHDYSIIYRGAVPLQRHQATLAFKAATQVSRAWRRIARACPFIWGHVLDIDYASVEWIRLVLEKSRSAPLFVQSITDPEHNSEWDSSSKWTALLSQVHRFKVLHISFNDQLTVNRPIGLALDRPAPILASFCIFNDSGSWVAPPYPLLKNKVPVLRTLRLENFPMPPFLPLAHALTTLSVVCGAEHLSRSVDRWLITLNLFPVLEDLYISDAIFLGNFVPHRPVQMAHLKKFVIKARLAPCAALLAVLVLPSTSTLCVEISETGPIPQAELGRDLSLVLRLWAHRSVLCMFWTISLTERNFIIVGRESETNARPLFNITFCFARNDPALPLSFSSVVDILLRYGRLGIVKTLYLNFNPDQAPLIPTTLISILKQGSSVRKLYLVTANIASTITYLMRLIEVNGSPAGDIVLPNLRHMILDQELCSMVSNTRTILQDFVAWRRSRGRPVEAGGVGS